MTKTLMKILSAVFMILMAVSVHRAQPSIHPGIDLYKAGKYYEAVTALNFAVGTKEFKGNGEIWNYLGMAYFAKDDYKNAMKAFEKAVKLDPAKSAYRINLGNANISLGKFKKAASESEKAIAIDPSSVAAYSVHGIASFQIGKFDAAEKDANRILELDGTVTTAYVLKAHLVMEKVSKRLIAGSTLKQEVGLLLTAKELLATGKELCKNNSDHEIVDQEYQSMSAFHSYFSGTKPEPVTDPLTPEPNVTRLKILEKPRPSYTDSARQANIQGTIKMAILFSAEGKVKHILLIKRLGNGLDQNAVNAARRIVFEPQKRDGKPVSVVRIIEYMFSIY